MNAIIKFFKSIIGLITGLFGSITGLLSGKQGKKDFFMEAAPAETPPPLAADVTDDAAADTAASNGKAKSGKAQNAKTAPQQAKKAGKAVAAGAAAAAATITATPQVLDSVDIIRAALNASRQTSEQRQTQAEANASFAEMNAVPVALTGRRRPGANMTGYLDMAKTMRTSR